MKVKEALKEEESKEENGRKIVCTHIFTSL